MRLPRSNTTYVVVGIVAAVISLFVTILCANAAWWVMALVFAFGSGCFTGEAYVMWLTDRSTTALKR